MDELEPKKFEQLYQGESVYKELVEKYPDMGGSRIMKAIRYYNSIR